MAQKFCQTDEILHRLMPQRITELLLVASVYDAFILEQEGHLIEQFYSEFQDSKLVQFPRITQVSSYNHAIEQLQKKDFDLIIIISSFCDSYLSQIVITAKEKNPILPVVLLLNNPMAIDNMALENCKLDGIFLWTGDTILFSAIIHWVEDKINFEEDVQTGLVKIVLLLDDHVQSYSQFLPVVYQEIIKQTHVLMQEGLNPVQQMVRQQARPKILLATNIASASAIFEKYPQDILGFIARVALEKNSQNVDGLKFAQQIKAKFSDLPVILIGDPDDAQCPVGIAYIRKDSPTFRNDLRNFMTYNMGFGDFVFRRPDGSEVGRAHNVREFQTKLLQIPDESLLYHASRNHISLWLLARGEYELALDLRPKHIEDFGSVLGLRNFIVTAIANCRDKNQLGMVVRYKPNDWDSSFIQIGDGSLGGKARGIAFINHLINTSNLENRFSKVQLKIPKTVVLTTDQFDDFLELNHLRQYHTIQDDDHEISKRFVSARLTDQLIAILTNFLQYVSYPLAIRSSSLLEDSQYLPFAGIYSTYMIANNQPNLEDRLQNLIHAIKLVYASVFHKRSRSYIEATPYQLEQEKMAVVIQEIIGQTQGQYFYPNFSGVAQSYNFYPFSHMQSGDGAAQVAMGLGRIVIEGGNTVRFCPKYPNIIPQFSTLQDTLKNAQNYFYVLNLKSNTTQIMNEDDTTTRLECNDAPYEVIRKLSSIYDMTDMVLRDDMFSKTGYRIVNFSPILRYNVFPLCDILSELLPLLRSSMGKEIEMEFAVNMYENPQIKPCFYVLQVRPLTISKVDSTITKEEKQKNNLICRCNKALGNGISETQDVVYISPARFDKAHTREMAVEVAHINRILHEQNRNYLLIGIGRWGTSDHWLGIPVDWDQISNVLAMVEVGLSRDFFADASLGSHFFQNITCRSIGYFSISGRNIDDFVDWEYLNHLKATIELNYVRYVQLPSPCKIKIDGRISEGVIIKPNNQESSQVVTSA